MNPNRVVQRVRQRFAKTAFCLVLATALTTSSAWSANPEEKAAAEALFDDGVKLLKAGSLDAACKKLEASQRIDPGIGTLLYLGECYEKSGKTASAWATFREAASVAQAAGQSERARWGQQRADKLVGNLSKLTIEPGAQNREISSLQISSDGQPVLRSLWSTPLPVDPGPHALEASAEGYESVQLTVTVGPNAQSQTVEIPALKKAAPLEPSPVTPPPPAPPPADKSLVPPTGPPEESGNGQRTAGVVTAVVGGVALGLGGAFGILAIVNNRDAKAGNCEPEDCLNPTSGGADAARAAADWATASTIGMVAGGALVAVGAVLYVTAPNDPEVGRLRISPAPGGAAMSWEGTF